jgi:hypothetical protein
MPKLPYSFNLFVVIGIHFDEVFPLFGTIIFREDGLDRTSRLASSAIDALIGVDVEHLGCFEGLFILARMNAIYRANVDTGGVFGPNAGLRYHISHLNLRLLSDLSLLRTIDA